MRAAYYEELGAARNVLKLGEMPAAGALTTTIAGRFPLDDIAAAHEMVEAAKQWAMSSWR